MTWKNRRPTFDECKTHAMMPAAFPGNGQIAIAVWLPQLGGYGSPSTVFFDAESNCNEGGPGCFDVAVFHDGDFPHDEQVTSAHFCHAGQLIEFACEVLTEQAKRQKRGRMTVEDRDAFAAMVKAIPAEGE